MITDAEINALATRYGEPLRRSAHCEMDETLFFTRFMRAGDRRGEVTLVIELPTGRLVLHRKAHYGADHFRLPTGGVRWDEAVDDAAVREAQEECGLTVDIVRFLAVLHTTQYFGAIRLPFVSCLFHLRAAHGLLHNADGEVAAFSDCLPAELPVVAATLRAIPDPRGYWGRWRALAHDIAADAWPIAQSNKQ